jgi:glycosyltransferase involved in cell wall biosynthesis
MSTSVPGAAPFAPRGAFVVANRLPFPLDDGWKVRTFHITRAIARLAPTLLAVGGSYPAATLAATATALGSGASILTFPLENRYRFADLARGALFARPAQYWRCQSAEGHREVARMIGADGFDLGVAVTTFMWPYLQALAPSARRVVDTHNVDSVVLERYAGTMGRTPRAVYAKLTARKMRALECDTYAGADEVWVCSQTEQELGRSLAPSARIAVVPNGVDLRALSPAGMPAPVPDRLVFVGRMDYFPNLDGLRYFTQEILPLIRRQRPGVTLEVAGQGIGAAARALADASPGVTLLGGVDDIRPVVSRASAVIAPLRSGGGTRLKILEALALARPVISTRIGAEGLDLAPEQEILLADSPADFAARVVEVLASPERARVLGEAGRRAVEGEYDWDTIGAELRARIGALPAPGSA